MPDCDPDTLLRFTRLMAAAMDAGDPFTHGRAYHCAKYATALGQQLGMKDDELHQLEFAGLLQDLGKKLVLYETSRKAGPLSTQERTRMASHAQIAARLLKSIDFLSPAADLIASLNERFDGAGVPRGHASQDIPLGSRILAVASAFDALTSDRPYRRGLGPDEAFSELKREAGTRFDPAVVTALIALHESGNLFAGFDEEDALYYLGEAGLFTGVDTQPDSGPFGLLRSA